jgi:hypothetical protein
VNEILSFYNLLNNNFMEKRAINSLEDFKAVLKEMGVELFGDGEPDESVLENGLDGEATDEFTGEAVELHRSDVDVIFTVSGHMLEKVYFAIPGDDVVYSYEDHI